MKFNLILFIALACVFLPLSTHAGEFVGLVGIPGIEPSGDTDLNAYINALYRLSISIAALLAVIKIVAAGAKYMLTDIVPAKEEAKKDIQGALIGLLIVIGAIIILNTINTDLTNLNLTVPEAAINDGGPTVAELIALQQRSIEERAAALGSRAQTFQCESVVGVNNFDMQDGESEEQACRRICSGPGSTFNGRFIDNIPGFTDQCIYVEADAARCDLNSNWTCCEYVNEETWDSRSQTCSTAEAPVTTTQCADEVEYVPFTFNSVISVDSCQNLRQACIDSGNTVLSSMNPTEGIDRFGSPVSQFGNVACSDNEQAAANETAAAQEAAEIQQCADTEGGRWNPDFRVCETGEPTLN
jgi:hypothetical protein